MAAPLYTDALLAACPDFVSLKADVGLAPTIRAADYVAARHGMYCPTCGPIVDRIRAEFSRHVRRLELDAHGIWHRAHETRPVDTITAGSLL